MALPGPGPNAHVVVTGAASVLGAAIGRGLSARGYPTVLVDRDADATAAVAAGLPDARTMPADLSDEAGRGRVRDVVTGDPGVVGLVNAAAGTAVGNVADSGEPAELAALLRVGVEAMHELTTAAVRAFVPRGVGAVLTVTTAEAFAPAPGAATRAAAQAFARSFGEAVDAELRGTGVSLTTLTAASTGPLARALGAGPDHAAGVGIAGMVAGRRTAAAGIASMAAQVAPRMSLLGVHRWI